MKVLQTLLPIVALALSACSSAPVQEMSDARQAISAASTAEADKHAPKLMLRAKNRLIAAENALKQGEWKEARKSAIEARNDAIAARAKADTGSNEN